MRILICDDDESIVKQLEKYIAEFFNHGKIKVPEIQSYNNGEALLSDTNNKDIVFLDIELPGVDGIFVGRELKEKNHNAIIFVITSYDEYLDDAMRFHVFRYLSKPLDKQRLFQSEESDTSLITDIRSGCLEALSEYDITALFSNLLDNAVDATKHIPGSFIELSVTPHNDNDLIITMINSCKNNPFSARGHRLVSSKQNKRNHGYGMKSIQRVVTKYHGNSQFHFEPENSTFHTVIILKL